MINKIILAVFLLSLPPAAYIILGTQTAWWTFIAVFAIAAMYDGRKGYINEKL